MGSTRHEKSFVTFEKGYEQNVVGLRGIVYFGIGLLLLIVITFALMWALLGVFADDAKKNAAATSPLMLNEKERLPPEPRLQLAPGWAADTVNGPINLELNQPGAEWTAIRTQWEEQWKDGIRDPKSGVTSMLPIAQAEQKLLEQNVKARNDDASKSEGDKSRLFFTDASSGRVASEKRR